MFNWDIYNFSIRKTHFFVSSLLTIMLDIKYLHLPTEPSNELFCCSGLGLAIHTIVEWKMAASEPEPPPRNPDKINANQFTTTGSSCDAPAVCFCSYTHIDITYRFPHTHSNNQPVTLRLHKIIFNEYSFILIPLKPFATIYSCSRTVHNPLRLFLIYYCSFACGR